MTFHGLRSILSRLHPGRWIFTLLVVLATTFVARWVEPLLALGSPFALSFLYSAMVLGIAFRHGMGPAVLATACGAVGIIFIRVASSTLGASAYSDLATETAFFAAWSLLGAGLIQAARRPPRPPR